MEITHFAFSDEASHTTSERYGAIAVISIRASIRQELENTLKSFIDKIPNEYKWVKFKNKSYFEISKEIFDKIFYQANKGNLRVDTIIWDSEDTRYYRNSTNYDSKLRVLYYLRLRDIISTRWMGNTNWEIIIDSQNQIDCNELLRFLRHYSGNTLKETIFGKDFDMRDLMQNPQKFQVERLSQADSEDMLFIQIADIFAGVSAYSHNKADELLEWFKFDSLQHPDSYGNIQLSLGLNSIEKREYTGRELWRFRFIKYIQEKCKTKKYQVSLSAKRGLHTFDPQSPINFFFTGE